jgi:hypothetical protein
MDGWMNDMRESRRIASMAFLGKLFNIHACGSQRRGTTVLAGRIIVGICTRPDWPDLPDWRVKYNQHYVVPSAGYGE